MTYQLYEKDGKWYHSYNEAGGKPDKVVYLEHPDSMYPNEDKVSPTIDSLIEEAKAGKYFTGMYGYKEPDVTVKEEPTISYWGGVH